jgi:hypothetical protein
VNITELNEKIDALVCDTVKKNEKVTMRLKPDGANEQRAATCISDVATLLALELTPSELATYAAGVKYTALSYKYRWAILDRQLDEVVQGWKLANKGAEGTASDAIDILKRLSTESSIFISGAVRFGAVMESKVKGAKGGNKRIEKISEVKKFAIDLFDKRTWKNPKQASVKLFPQVQAQAKLLGWTMSVEQGEKTLYDWLRAHKKSTGQPIDV